MSESIDLNDNHKDSYGKVKVGYSRIAWTAIVVSQKLARRKNEEKHF